jgi:enamine deaminase RidA (YjgF/YER057c/UK114 family)
VINGCSDLFVQVLGDKGKHARSAVGLGSLPMGIPVEIEVIVEVENRGQSPISPRRKGKSRK